MDYNKERTLYPTLNTIERSRIARILAASSAKSQRNPRLFILNRMQAGETQPRRFVPAEHEVHTLDGGAGGAFHEVVDGADGDDAAGRFVEFKTHIGVVAAGEDLGFGVAVDAGLLFDEADKGFVAIALAIGAPELFFGGARFDEEMSGG